MNENIQALLDKLGEDEELLAKFEACETIDEVYELATGIVGGYTKEELWEALKRLNTAEEGDLSDEDLAEVSGGSIIKTVWKGVKKGAKTAGKAVSSAAKTVYEPVGELVTGVGKFVVDIYTGKSDKTANVPESADDGVETLHKFVD